MLLGLRNEKVGCQIPSAPPWPARPRPVLGLPLVSMTTRLVVGDSRGCVTGPSPGGKLERQYRLACKAAVKDRGARCAPCVAAAGRPLRS